MEGLLADRSPAAPGTVQDAEALAAVPLQEFYDAETEPARLSAVRGILEHRGITPAPGDAAGALLYAALSGYAPMGLLVNQTMRRAMPVSELGRSIFPDAHGPLADRAASALVALGSAARRSSEDASLLPCRVHAFFRGLPGLWACLDPDCPEADTQAPGQSGPAGRAVRAAPGGLRLRRAGLRVLHLP